MFKKGVMNGGGARLDDEYSVSSNEMRASCLPILSLNVKCMSSRSCMSIQNPSDPLSSRYE
jgi:hypothetical protein